MLNRQQWLGGRELWEFPEKVESSWGAWRRRGRSNIGSLFIYGILRNYKLSKLPRLTLWLCNWARSWTCSSQAWAVHKTEQLSVFRVFCPDAMLAMPVMGKHSTWLNMKTVRFLQGCTGDVQLYCTQDRSSPETIPCCAGMHRSRCYLTQCMNSFSHKALSVHRHPSNFAQSWLGSSWVCYLHLSPGQARLVLTPLKEFKYLCMAVLLSTWFFCFL